MTTSRPAKLPMDGMKAQALQEFNFYIKSIPFLKTVKQKD